MLEPPSQAMLDGDDDLEALEAYMAASLAWWDQAIGEVREWLLARDEEMRKQYA